MIVLTGASGGIGQELLRFLIKTDNVVGIYNNSYPAIPEDDTLRYDKVDLTNEIEVREFVSRNEKLLTQITLIHGAACKVDGLVAGLQVSDWVKMLSVNMTGNFLFTQALLPIMIREQWGRIIHISSSGAIQGAPGAAGYSASKTGILGLSRVLGKEYGRFNITSNVLSLGAFEFGMYLDLDEIIKKEIIDRIPSKKLGNISNIVNAIDFLIKSEYVNASVIELNGGAL